VAVHTHQDFPRSCYTQKIQIYYYPHYTNKYCFMMFSSSSAAFANPRIPSASFSVAIASSFIMYLPQHRDRTGGRFNCPIARTAGRKLTIAICHLCTNWFASPQPSFREVSPRKNGISSQCTAGKVEVEVDNVSNLNSG